MAGSNIQNGRHAIDLKNYTNCIIIYYVCYIWAFSISKWGVQYQEEVIWFEVQLENIYMGKVTNQDGCHTTNMKNDENWKYLLYGH